ncbi:GNAT family N-acetyltransferase [Rufibacter roseus]|uniref:GNAT family N-acetyltransferase n=1 Tax=Rufibacter roseus TaxID=1567108 RepID=A0ABW2DJE7_9BACT|nr:GNAT family N-acetyltransferase [Rufibacter roseus]
MNTPPLNYKLLTEFAQAPWELLLDADPNRTLVEEYLSEGFCFLAYAQEELVGEFVVVPLQDAERWEVKNIAVSPAWQGKGIGKELLKKAMKEAAERGGRWLEIGTGNSSLGQLALYQKMGFWLKEVWPDFFTRHYPEPIVENGMLCRDMVRLERAL